MKKIISVFTIIAIITSFSICAFADTSNLTEPNGTLPTLDEFVESIAKRADESKTGNLVVYSTCSEAENDGAKRMFNALYPNIKVEFVLGSTSEVTSRIEAESANPQGDVMFGGLNQSSYNSYADLFEKYVPIGFENMKDIYATDQTNVWNVFDSPAVIINKTLQEDMGFTIETYEDLLNPELKGWIIAADPLTSSSSRSWFLAALLAHGGVDNDEAWAYVDALMDNFDGFLSSESSNAYLLPQTGEYAVGLSYQSACLRAQNDGADTEYVVLSPTIAQGYGSGLIIGCPNEENAKLFIDFTICDEFQSYYSTIGQGPVTKTAIIYDDALAKAVESVNPIDVDWNELSNQIDTFKTLWAEHWAAHS